MKFVLAIILTATVACVARAADLPTLFICGDSTAKNSGPGKNGSPVQGWGTPIADYFDPAKITVANVAHAGQSSFTYYTKDWPAVLPKIHSGDYLLLVFGINDGSTPPGTGDEINAQGTHTYGWYMSQMATDAQEKGAHTYFLTVTTRNLWTNPKAKFTDATPAAPLPADYDATQDKIERGTANGRMTRTTKEVAQKLDLPVFDLTNYCADLYEKMGRTEVDKLYSDHNHTYVPGARIVAAAIVSGLKAFKESPFTPLLSEKGQALKPADAKYVADNLPIPK